MSKERQEKVSKYILYIQNYAIIVPILGMFISFVPFIPLIDSDYYYIYYYIFLLSYWLLSFIQSTQALIVLYHSIIQIKSSITTISTKGHNSDPSPNQGHNSDVSKNETNKKLQTIYNGLNIQYNITLIRFIISSLLWLLFTTVPILYHKFTYFYIINYYSTYFTGLLALRNFWTFKKQSTITPAPPISTVSRSGSANSSGGGGRALTAVLHVGSDTTGVKEEV